MLLCPALRAGLGTKGWLLAPQQGTCIPQGHFSCFGPVAPAEQDGYLRLILHPLLSREVWHISVSSLS